MCSALDYQVVSLQRIRIMNIKLGGLAVGQWRDLTKAEKEEFFLELNYTPRKRVKLTKKGVPKAKGQTPQQLNTV